MLEVDPNWWQTLFDDIYLLTDGRSVCDDALTRREVDFLVEHLGLGADERVLDLCGGQGRHSLELARRGYRHLTVLDYSETLLRHGKDRAAAEGLRVSFLRADARSTGCSGGRFDCVLLMANSFGYFSEDEENLRVLREARRVCRPGGRFLLDLLDRTAVIRRFRPFSCHRIPGKAAVIRVRERDDRWIRVHETVLSATGGVLRERRYGERLFTARRLRTILAQAGFAEIRMKRGFSSHARAGDYGFMNSRVMVTARPG